MARRLQLLLVLVLLAAAPAAAEDYRIRWDYPETELPKIDEFRVYSTIAGVRWLKATVTRDDAGQLAPRAVVVLTQPGEHSITITAARRVGSAINESDDSPALLLDTTRPVAPGQPEHEIPLPTPEI